MKAAIRSFAFLVGAMIFLPSASFAQTTAGLFRSYLSAKGVDTNPCTVDAPCRLLPAALAATQSGGEVWIVDSANYNTSAVQITQSVTILAVPGALGSIVTNSADGIDITANNVSVTLRNLVFRNLGTGTTEGVFVTGTGDELIVENSEFYGMYYGIFVSAGGAILQVNHSTFRNGGVAGVAVSGTTSSPASGVVDSSTFVSEAGYAIAANYAALTISNTNISQAGSNGYGILAVGGSRVLLTNNIITKNPVGVNIAGGTVTSSGNNTLDNTTNVSGGTITKVSQF